MKSLRRIFTAALALVLCLSSCKSQYEILLEGNDTEAKYAAAFDYFNQGKFTKASQLFESLSIITNGTSRDDTVQYYWGLSNYRAKDYMTALPSSRLPLQGHLPLRTGPDSNLQDYNRHQRVPDDQSRHRVSQRVLPDA